MRTNDSGTWISSQPCRTRCIPTCRCSWRSSSHLLAHPGRASDQFAKLRSMVPTLERAIADLESICEEERQLQRQVRMHRVLHGWLLVHVPLSFVLIALSAVHIIMALRF